MHRIALLALPGFYPLELGAAAQIFSRQAGYDLLPVSVAPLPSAGMTVTTTYGLDALDAADTVIVPGYDDTSAALPSGTIEALRAAGKRGARLVSFCSGAFALAAAGVLDGRPATTHWQKVDEFRARYPTIDVQPDRLYVDDGDVLTSAGVTACIDLSLHLIRRDQGAAAANDHARALVAPPRRSGGQLQYIDRVPPRATGDDLSGLREWMAANLRSEVTIDALAGRAHMSRRTFVRRFRDETGTSPIAWLTAVRIDRARELLEASNASIERIGQDVGFDAPASFRNAFHRHLGTSPQAYRATFRLTEPVATPTAAG